MTSLRRRLTISYTVLVGAFMAIVAMVLTWIAFDAVVRPIGGAIASAASGARAIVALEPQITPEALAPRVRGLVMQGGIAVFVMRAPGPPPNGPGGPGGPGGPNGPGGPGGPGEGFGPPPGGAGDRGRSGVTALLLQSLGIHAEFVRAASGELAIVPDRDLLQSRAQQFFAVLVAVLLLALISAWLIARWIAAQAVAPLIAVTAELRRFANGDFTPSTVPLGSMSDVGQLIAAYNGAAEQVAAAFDERERAEGRMRRFLADAGHELRTPLSIVTAYVDVLRKGGVDDAHVRAQAFGTLSTEMTRMRRLVDRLVALARLEAPETTHPVVVDLGALARDAVASIVAARAGDVSCEVESGTFVLADPGDLHEAITNLVDNALKYGAGSLVRIMVEHERDAVAVRVSDCGPGIPPLEQEKIFDRFYRGSAQQETEGSGLGLAIAARAAKRAGGDLTLERSGDGETVFAVRLPLHVVASVG